MEPVTSGRLRARALVAGLGLGLGGLLALAACGDGNGGVALPSERPSVERTAEADSPRPSRTRTTDTTRTTKPTRTTEPARTTDPAPAQTENAPPAQDAATTTTAATVSAVPAGSPTGDDGGLGLFGWLCLLSVPFALLAVALLVGRSRRSRSWDDRAAALAADTLTVTRIRLPAVLSTETPAKRALAWPPLREDLIRLGDGWAVLAGGGADEGRCSFAAQIAVLVRDLVAAMDGENEALAAGRDWRLVRPAVDAAGQALAYALAAQPVPGQYPGGEPGPAGSPA